MNVNLGGIKVNVLDHGSVLNMGPNQMTDIFISYKRNQGYGEQNGDIAPMLIPISFLLDNDLMDSSTVKNSIL
ncbi:hypothetical protein [Neobacillus cucumis]